MGWGRFAGRVSVLGLLHPEASRSILPAVLFVAADRLGDFSRWRIFGFVYATMVGRAQMVDLSAGCARGVDNRVRVGGGVVAGDEP